MIRESIPSSPRGPLPGAGGQSGGPVAEKTITGAQTDVERKLSISSGQQIQGNLCVSVPNGNFGPDTREAIRQAKLAANESRTASSAPRLFGAVNNQIGTNREAQIFLDAKPCEVDRSGIDRAYATSFEKFRFADEIAIKDLQTTLANRKCDPNVKPTGIFDQATRNAIMNIKANADATTKRTFIFPDTNKLDAKSYDWVLAFCV